MKKVNKNAIRADYSGLDWSLIAKPLETEETCPRCGGKVYYCEEYKSKFCSSCGRWVDPKRPKNAIEVLHSVKSKIVKEPPKREKFVYDWPK